MVFSLLALLAAASPSPVVRTQVRAQLSVGDLMGASWYVPAGRARIEDVWSQTRGMLRGEGDLQALTIAYALPMVGPWLSAGSAEGFERGMLITSGLLQALGLAVAFGRLATDDAGVVETGPMISLSPIVSGQLGVAIKISHF